ncbi:dephospho-CoA kinase [Aquisalimonas asiatica]|uniref:Dephospho-CoA kinase n=1 Tax=Aquisalimonas asiatica TaxID=406100 RepID=A0A1H8S648_9GAMM|nr:dephospho-CoA kinase [Aquisalimonas asiatica]SEO74489.1 dephospho-CoA kinase [Aquisalimonas asiatica]
MHIIGLTGGIASGKTTVSDLFAGHGITVVDADVAARRVVEPGQPALSELVEAFGDQIVTADGTLDRQQLRNTAFADEAARRRLEGILHPRIRAFMDEELSRAQGPYAILSVPLLVESNLLDMVDRVLVVDVPDSVQRERLIARDGSTPEQAEAIIAAQTSREQRLRHADDVIDNTRDMTALKQQIETLHQAYIAMAERSTDTNAGLAEH